MNIRDWPKQEIQRLAMSSGKPMEVLCAQTFLAAGWTARLGSHFTSDPLDTIRELDVLAEKEEQLPALGDLTFRLRVLVSCRGFPSERAPLTYSVSSSCVPSFSPRLLSNHRARQYNTGGLLYGPLPSLEEASAERLLSATSLAAARPVVAFDLLERNVTTGKGVKKVATASYKRCGDGDRQLYSAIDSAVKAAFYWRDKDYANPAYFSVLNVPVCILSQPFWDACIDGGEVAEPEIRHRGYQCNSYPDRPNPTQAMVVVWSSDELSELVRALDDLFAWFRDELKKPEYASRWTNLST